MQRAGCDDHFASCVRGYVPPALPIKNCVRASAFELDSRRVRVGLHIKVRARFGGPEISRRGRAAQAVTRRELVVPGALLRRSVEIAILRDADFDGSGDQRVDQRMTLFNIGGP